METLEDALGITDGVPLIGAVEDHFLKRRHFPDGWIGFVHLCPNTPAFFETIYNLSPLDLQGLLNLDDFSEKFRDCRGVFTLSRWLGDWLRERISIPVESVVHPVGLPTVTFSFDRFRSSDNSSLLMLGGWLRSLWAFNVLDSPYPKFWLKGDVQCSPERWLEIEAAKSDSATFQVTSFQSEDSFDDLLAGNICFASLYAASANNMVVDCLIRATPLLINKLPPVTEYLGEDYPLYYSNLSEASRYLRDHGRIKAAHQHMIANPIVPELSPSAFVNAVSTGGIYTGL